VVVVVAVVKEMMIVVKKRIATVVRRVVVVKMMRAENLVMTTCQMRAVTAITVVRALKLLLIQVVLNQQKYTYTSHNT